MPKIFNLTSVVYNKTMDNINILPENEYTEVEGRRYLNPNLQVTQTDDFINNLRTTQQANNQQIVAQTQNLGTEVPSNLGGLVGGEGYWTSRYQTPQTNTATQNLRTAAQAAALNQALKNEKAMWDKRYQEAYRAYQKRQNDKTNQDPYANAKGDDPDYETTTPGGANETSVAGVAGSYTVVDPAGNLHVVDMNTGDEETIAPGQSSQTRTTATAGIGGGEIRTLPNGNTVWIRPGYSLTKDNGKYYLVNQGTGARTEVGGY